MVQDSESGAPFFIICLACVYNQEKMCSVHLLSLSVPCRWKLFCVNMYFPCLPANIRDSLVLQTKYTVWIFILNNSTILLVNTESQHTQMHEGISPRRNVQPLWFYNEISSRYQGLSLYDVKRSTKIDGMGPFKNFKKYSITT